MTAAVHNGRGKPQVVTLRTTTALAPILTGAALAQETVAACDRIALAAAVGRRQVVVLEAGRLSHHAAQTLTELRQAAALVERR
jgi:hypothetical protein